jgi:hypothetical protein
MNILSFHGRLFRECSLSAERNVWSEKSQLPFFSFLISIRPLCQLVASFSYFCGVIFLQFRQLLLINWNVPFGYTPLPYFWIGKDHSCQSYASFALMVYKEPCGIDERKWKQMAWRNSQWATWNEIIKCFPPFTRGLSIRFRSMECQWFGVFNLGRGKFKKSKRMKNNE